MKAIKDLTQEEVNNIHYKYYDIQNGCCNCPLLNKELDFIKDCTKFYKAMRQHMKALNKLIEVQSND